VHRALAFVVFLAGTGVARVAFAGSCDDLVRAGRSMEATGDADRALRAYNDAIGLDPTCRDAYLRLGAIREARHDFREAERVYSIAIDHVPTSREAFFRRAAVRLILGRDEEAIAELRYLGEAEPADEAALKVALDSLRRLDEYFTAHDLVPARLGVWRRMAVLTEHGPDAAAATQARSMVRALSLVVGPADPVANPNAARGLRPLIARSAR
jgi:tetratricopeptide (TPR) repeat protein